MKIRAIKLHVSNIGLSANSWPLSHYAYRDLFSQLPKDVSLYSVETDSKINGLFYFVLNSKMFKEVEYHDVPAVQVSFTQDANGIVSTKVIDIQDHLDPSGGLSAHKILPTGNGYAHRYAIADEEITEENENLEKKEKENVEEKTENSLKEMSAEDAAFEKAFEKVTDFFFPMYHKECTCGHKMVKDVAHAENCPSYRKWSNQ